MTRAGKQRFADTDWVNTSLFDNPLERLPASKPKGKPPVERSTMLDSAFAIQDGLLVDEVETSDSEWDTLFGTQE